MNKIFRFVIMGLLAPGLVLAAAAVSDHASTGNVADAAALFERARSQYLVGEPRLAVETLDTALRADPTNASAVQLRQRIQVELRNPDASRDVIATRMEREVDRAWENSARPSTREEPLESRALSAVRKKLESLIVPAIQFDHLDLRHVVSTLAEVSRQCDPATDGQRGVNFTLVDPSGTNPALTISLRDLPLARVVDLVAESAGFAVSIRDDVVTFRPDSGPGALETRIFPLAHGTATRLTGRAAIDGKIKAPPTTLETDAASIRSFLQLAGVGFDVVPGSSVAFDGAAVIVTQTERNLERIRVILDRYRVVRQVEIEARFMEIQDGALEEIGLNWTIGRKDGSQSGLAVSNYATSNRSVNAAFSSQGATDNLTISSAPTAGDPDNGVAASAGLNLTLPVAPPGIPGGVPLGPANAALATLSGILGQFNVNAVLRALSQRSGTELLSSPKVTVLSGSQATITVAQELRYPQAYGQMQSQVGTGGISGGGSAGVTITAGTPQDFVTRDIGVELRVTPTVEADGRRISLDLNPKVTEFEGFVEYGGSSVAISSGTTVTVPSGFYQPIFAVRDISTRVTLLDGATLVMGGLTREDVKTTNDKVPVLGNVPVLGRLFRSDGSSSQKRNLMIFVTANLVSPDGTTASAGPAESPLYAHPILLPSETAPARRR
ncbi:MAG TPA: hypothetical protein VGM73_00540 [Candidatus Didemnitutus sp.]|jgi:general secretion pathway protein D